MIRQLVIINNESVFQNDNDFFCDNIDMKSIPEGLSKNFEVVMISRKSKKRSAKRTLFVFQKAS